MSAAQFDLGLRLAAYDRRALVHRTAVKRFALRPDAMMIAVVASPGDHGGLWGMSFAPANAARPTVHAVADPRRFASQVELWTAAARAWRPWLDRCETDGSVQAAQFVVADPAAAERVTWSATRVVRSSFEEAEDARRAARAFLLAHNAARSLGQQSLAVLTTVMREHYVTGADPLDEGHLGLWAQWPNLQGESWKDPQVSLPPGADGEHETLGKAWDRMVRAKGEIADVHGNLVQAQIRQLAERRWRTLRTVTALYAHDRAPVLQEATARATSDANNYLRHMSAGRLPSGRSQRARWTSLAVREVDAGHWQSALWAEDQMERARGQASGDVLAGTAQAGVIRTVQPALRVRPGDEMTTPDGLTFTVTSLEVDNGGVLVHTDTPDLEGEQVAWPKPATIFPPIPKVVPWTHDPDQPVRQFERPPGDLEALVASMVG